MSNKPLVPSDAAPPSIVGHVAGGVRDYSEIILPVGDGWDADL